MIVTSACFLSCIGILYAPSVTGKTSPLSMPTRRTYMPPTNTTSLLSRYPLHKNEEQPGHSFDFTRHGINLHKTPQMRVNNLHRVIITPKHLKVKPRRVD